MISNLRDIEEVGMKQTVEIRKTMGFRGSREGCRQKRYVCSSGEGGGVLLEIGEESRGVWRGGVGYAR
jgi:hypothetical protein